MPTKKKKKYIQKNIWIYWFDDAQCKEKKIMSDKDHWNKLIQLHMQL